MLEPALLKIMFQQDLSTRPTHTNFTDWTLSFDSMGKDGMRYKYLDKKVHEKGPLRRKGLQEIYTRMRTPTAHLMAVSIFHVLVPFHQIEYKVLAIETSFRLRPSEEKGCKKEGFREPIVPGNLSVSYLWDCCMGSLWQPWLKTHSKTDCRTQWKKGSWNRTLGSIAASEKCLLCYVFVYRDASRERGCKLQDTESSKWVAATVSGDRVQGDGKADPRVLCFELLGLSLVLDWANVSNSLWLMNSFLSDNKASKHNYA